MQTTWRAETAFRTEGYTTQRRASPTSFIQRAEDFRDMYNLHQPEELSGSEDPESQMDEDNTQFRSEDLCDSSFAFHSENRTERVRSSSVIGDLIDDPMAAFASEPPLRASNNAWSANPQPLLGVCVENHDAQDAHEQHVGFDSEGTSQASEVYVEYTSENETGFGSGRSSTNNEYGGQSYQVQVDAIGEPYTRYVLQQQDDTSWQGISEPHEPEDVQHSTEVPDVGGPGNSFFLDHVGNQMISAITPLQTSIDHPLPWISSEPWNALHVSYGTPVGYNQTQFHNSSASSQLPSSQNLSYGAVSSRSIEPTWVSNSSYRFNHIATTDNTNTNRRSLTPGNLEQVSQSKSHASGNSVHTNPGPMIVRDPPFTANGHKISCVEADTYPRSPYHLAIPDDTVSLPSVTPNNVAGVLYCQHEGCGQKFTGTHRRGTLHRHIRLKHMTGQDSFRRERQYFCEVVDCGKDFKRQDARLKHYRSKHPELGIAAPKSRKQESQ